MSMGNTDIYDTATWMYRNKYMTLLWRGILVDIFFVLYCSKEYIVHLRLVFMHKTYWCILLGNVQADHHLSKQIGLNEILQCSYLYLPICLVIVTVKL